jgi:hypothetical protein
VRFLRHLGAATLVVAVVVVLGLAWNRVAPGTLIGTLHGPGQLKVVPGAHGVRRLAGAGALPRGIRIGGPAAGGTSGMNLGLNSMFQAVNLPYLKHTLEIEAALIAGVVLLDAGRRKLRRVKRTRQIAQRPGGDDAATHASASGKPAAQ